MIHACENSKEPGMQSVCGLLETENIAGSDSEGLLLELTEIVERFQITWAVSPLHELRFAERRGLALSRRQDQRR